MLLIHIFQPSSPVNEEKIQKSPGTKDEENALSNAIDVDAFLQTLHYT